MRGTPSARAVGLQEALHSPSHHPPVSPDITFTPKTQLLYRWTQLDQISLKTLCTPQIKSCTLEEFFSRSHQRAEAGRDPLEMASSCSEQAAQDCVQLGSGHLEGWRLYSLSKPDRGHWTSHLKSISHLKLQSTTRIDPRGEPARLVGRSKLLEYVAPL